MAAHNYEDLKKHIGHKIVCVGYGDLDNPANVAIECETCSEVILSYDSPQWEEERNFDESTEQESSVYEES